MQAKGGSLG